MTNSAQRTAAPAGLWFSIKIDSEEFVALLAADALDRLLESQGHRCACPAEIPGRLPAADQGGSVGSELSGALPRVAH